MARPLVTSAAERDFTDALRWYAERSLRAAEGFERDFDRALDAIGAAPESYPSCDSRHRFYLMHRYPYQIIYRLHGSDCAVIAVAHGKRQPEFWHGR